MAVGLKDIAADLNVSVSLVSKVLRNRLGESGTTPEMAEAIHQRARELGYRRNRTATLLVARRHGIVGLFIHRVGARGAGVVEDLLVGICQGASAHRQRLSLGYGDSEAEFRQFIENAHSGEIDGLVVAGYANPNFAPDLVGRQQEGLPLVTVFAGAVDARLPNLGVDQGEVMALAVNHLVDRGCRRLAHIRVDEARYRGFCEASAQHGMDIERERLFWGDYQYESGRAAVMHWLEREVAFDGIVAPSDQTALGAMHELLRRGVDVPGKVRVVGVDNSNAAQTAIVSLSSVSENWARRGKMAIEFLMSQIEERPQRLPCVSPSLHIRDSS